MCPRTGDPSLLSPILYTSQSGKNCNSGIPASGDGGVIVPQSAQRNELSSLVWISTHSTHKEWRHFSSLPRFPLLPHSTQTGPVITTRHVTCATRSTGNLQGESGNE
eukprot:scpid87129/ scgid34782/ 